METPTLFGVSGLLLPAAPGERVRWIWGFGDFFARMDWSGAKLIGHGFSWQVQRTQNEGSAYWGDLADKRLAAKLEAHVRAELGRIVGDLGLVLEEKTS